MEAWHGHWWHGPCYDGIRMGTGMGTGMGDGDGDAMRWDAIDS